MRRVWIALVRCPVCGVERPVRCSFPSHEIVAAKRTCRVCTDAAAVASGVRVRPYYGPRSTGPKLATEPTAWPPGTPEKVEVMKRRADRGEQVFHPDDAR